METEIIARDSFTVFVQYLITWSHVENLSSTPAQAELFASNSVKLAPLAAGEACVLDRIEPSLSSL
jgi:hypothetical protein